MMSNYQSIRQDNQRRYGTDIWRIGPMLLAERYADRTHFIFELLQNAEDALVKRGNWGGRRSIHFELRKSNLRVSHFGNPFDEDDVRGICGIAESTKDLTAIGRFGIGFKSVYAFTDRPVVYSGDESFVIENFVWPVAENPIDRDQDQTLFVLPLRNPADRVEIEAGLMRLGADSLLFLRDIEEIEWSVEEGPSGLYLRSQPKPLGTGVRQITVLGQTKGATEVEESWLIFSKPVYSMDGTAMGNVEVAFSLNFDDKAGRKQLKTVELSPLVVFFPTVLETHLGFRIQGPYRTTPSRDNVPPQDEWNRYCVSETTAVLGRALMWLRDNDYLDVDALRCLPLDRAKFPEGTMFSPIFEVVRETLLKEDLLPRHGGGHVSAQGALLARTQELRELLSPTQISELFGAETERAWLSGDISQDRTPELHDYLIKELRVQEIRPDTLFPKLSKAFLEAQSDEWMRRLYEFLGGQKALLQRVRELPLIRLKGGTHVPAQTNGQPQAYLPGPSATGFSTVRAAVCDTEESMAFLKSLGLSEPDLVDDVIVNVLPRYASSDVTVDATSYAADIERILRAYQTDSESCRRRLVEALRYTPFVASREQGANNLLRARPGDVYIATERMSQLFEGVGGVMLVDDSYECLKGVDARELLEASGAVRYLRPIEDTSLSWEEKRQLRECAGHPQTSGYNDRVEDRLLGGFKALLTVLPRLKPQERRKRAELLWEELGNLEERRGKGVFTAVYMWSHHGSYRQETDAAFVRLLNEEEWVPDADGNLCTPSTILFDSLGWQENPFLLSKIRFKPPILDQLAKEAGIEPGVLDLLKKLGVTNEAQLRQRLGVTEQDTKDAGSNGGSVDDALKKLGIMNSQTPAVADPTEDDPLPTGGHGVSAGRENAAAERTPGTAHSRPFISYVGAHPEDEAADPDGLNHGARMALEERAIAFILAREPQWQRTPANNPGYDLFESGPDGRSVRWCEVKAMTGRLVDRPVGLSHTQFEWAREHGESFWLYVVERAGTDEARLVRIRNPAGKASTFTFDHGWLNVAEGGFETAEQEE